MTLCFAAVTVAKEVILGRCFARASQVNSAMQAALAPPHSLSEELLSFDGDEEEDPLERRGDFKLTFDVERSANGPCHCRRTAVPLQPHHVLLVVVVVLLTMCVPCLR